MTETRSPGWTFYAGWMALSVLALPVGFVLGWGGISFRRQRPD